MALRATGRRPPRDGLVGLRDVTRVGMIVVADDVPWVLDAKVSPGMTETSLLPMGAHAAGLSLADLCDRILAPAAGRATNG